MKARAIETRIFREDDDLVPFIVEHVKNIPEGAVLAVASKIVALSEGRTKVVVSAKAKEALVKKESTWSKKVLPQWWLTVRDGSVAVNAGIDDSNGNGKLILLPSDSFVAAAMIRKALKKRYKVKELGVVITDSRIQPLRAGVTGVALGYAGFKGMRDYRGKKDLFGRKLSVTQTNVADSLATAATLLGGEGNERTPLVLIEGAPVQFSERVDRSEVSISQKSDLFRGLFS